MRYSTRKINYNSKFDVLDLSFVDNKNSYGEEDVDNIVEFRDTKTGKLTGLTILDFKSMFDTNDSRILSIQKKYRLDKVYKELFAK